MHRVISFIIISLIFSINLTARSKMKIGMTSDNILKTISEYRNKILKNKDDSFNLYLCTEYAIKVEKRNFILKLLPSMYPLAQGPRYYNGESISRITAKKDKIQTIDIEYTKGTITPNKDVISIIKNLFFPRIYNSIIYGDFILSPCHPYNRWLYKYSYKKLNGKDIEMSFYPKNKNAQLITGKAILNKYTGKIISMQFSGELDMIKFNVTIKMDDSLEATYIPEYCDIKTLFVFLGNKINSFHKIKYSTTKMVLNGNHDLGLDTSYNENKKNKDSINSVCGKNKDDDSNYIHKQAKKADSVDYVKQKKSFSRAYDYFVEKIKGRFGAECRGNYSISPLVNPLYLGYSSKKGVTYKLKINAGYAFTDNINFSLSAKCGYSFKQKQFYTNIPVRFQLGKYFSIDTEYSIGNHITNSKILDQLKHETYDSINWNKMNLEYFKNLHWRFRFNIILNKCLTLRQGLIYYKRSAVDRSGFISSGKSYKYYSFAPTLQLQIAPFNDKTAIITLDYERGIKGIMSSSSKYERFETDFSWKKKLYAMRLLSLKTGYGQYVSRSKNSYFLDYNNFRYENMPGGWDDDWTGEFQLLESNWYNASKFYVRSNVTYESPMLFLSRLPLIGKNLETERIYINFLFTDKLHPYVEYGYGFTNKLFSSGIFFSTSNKRVDGVGFRFGLELFRDW